MPRKARNFRVARLPATDFRPPSHRRGYDADWHKLRNWYIARHPLCAHCDTRGITAPADMVDHIQPLSTGGARLDQRNLQSLCSPCHAAKTATDQK